MVGVLYAVWLLAGRLSGRHVLCSVHSRTHVWGKLGCPMCVMRQAITLDPPSGTPLQNRLMARGHSLHTTARRGGGGVRVCVCVCVSVCVCVCGCVCVLLGQ